MGRIGILEAGIGEGSAQPVGQTVRVSGGAAAAGIGSGCGRGAVLRLEERLKLNAQQAPFGQQPMYGDPAPYGQQPAGPLPFYASTWFVILMLLFIGPVGLFLMWKFEKFSKVVRIIITVLLVLAWISNFLGS